MRTVAFLLAALFLFGALVQLNDPDPLRWMAIYLAAAVASLLFALRRGSMLLAATTAIVAAAWALWLATRAFGAVAVSELFASWEMKNERVEEGREMYGLLLIAAAMTAIAVAEWRRRKGEATDLRRDPEQR